MTTYPFTAIVGQERLKLALILNAVDPAVGGVLISGEKGTAKSTAVRALTEVLPEREEVEKLSRSHSTSPRTDLSERSTSPTL